MRRISPKSCATLWEGWHEGRGTQFSAIGALSRVVVAYFDWTTKDYRRIAIEEQVEVLSLVGDVSLDAGTPKVHAHVVVGKADATAHGGHLIEGHVRPRLEIILTETPATSGGGSIPSRASCSSISAVSSRNAALANQRGQSGRVSILHGLSFAQPCRGWAVEKGGFP